MIKEITTNKKAYHDYEILETFEAGIVLVGSEIKAIRAGKANLTGSYAKILQVTSNKVTGNMGNKLKANSYNLTANPELFILNMNITNDKIDPTRTRKLLMHRKEINRLIGKIQEKNLTLVALKLYIKDGKAKIQLGLARGKKLHDKRETIKKRDQIRASKRGEII